ncbi:MAG TPA: hypothetical protein VFC30_02915, partial [Solirubrobacteraceae bacterium]|nr:hypothetical protein [Solirubrobacteraceae bacterium]
TPPLEPVATQTKEDPQPVELIKERAKEVLPTDPTAEQAAESLASSPAVALQDAAPSNASSDPAPAEVSSAPIGWLTTGPTTGDPGGPSTASAASPASIDAPPLLSAAQRAGDFSCELSGPAGPMTSGCTVGQLGAHIFLSVSTVDIATGAAARMGVPGVGTNGDADGSANGSRSVGPPPGSAPGGAFGGSAPGGSGIALSSFSSLAGHLLPAAPRAMRRLRLSFQPWLTAFFVLIPERPG